MVAALTLAITGATGFVGARLLDRALADGHRVRALTRRDAAPRDGVTWVRGALDQPESLAALCAGADAVIHVAGVISGSAGAFEAGNVTGTRHMVDAARAAGIRRFVHVSSLAAREPQISLYGASKARSETIVRTAPLDWAIVRPPAVYGPGDRETLELFRMARRGLVALPPAGRLSVIHVDDLADLLLALVTVQAPSGLLVEPDDGSGGYSHADFAAMLGKAFDRKVLAVAAPAALLRAGAVVDRLVRGNRAKLTADRAAYFCHPDWTVSPTAGVPAALWRARVPTPAGLAATARWYGREGWL